MQEQTLFATYWELGGGQYIARCDDKYFRLSRILQYRCQAGPSSLNLKVTSYHPSLCILCFSILSLIMYQLIPYSLSVSSDLFDTWLSFIHLWQHIWHCVNVLGRCLSMHIKVHHPVNRC
jgi:hypothetical protein